MTVEIVGHRGWDVFRLTHPPLQVDVVPAKGADILAVRFLPLGINVLWESPWGLPARGAIAHTSDSLDAFMRSYPGGWQTLFPNAGTEALEHGIDWSFHGEACMTSWDVVSTASDALQTTMHARTVLRQSPFVIERTIAVEDDAVALTETVQNEAADPRSAMWVHHPAFGAPLLSGACRIDCGARTFVADDERDVVHGDLEPGASSTWPFARRRDGGAADLRVMPPLGEPVDRFGYLTGFEEGWARLSNSQIGLEVGLTWDAAIFPHAWFWLEAGATQGYPWFGRAYVLAIEPASTWPGQGIAVSRKKGSGPIEFQPGESRTITTRLSIRKLDGRETSVDDEN